MLIELLMKPFFLLIDFIITLFPTLPRFVYYDLLHLTSIRFGLYILPLGWWSSFVASVSAYLVIQMAWVIFEWIYKKIPGVD